MTSLFSIWVFLIVACDLVWLLTEYVAFAHGHSIVALSCLWVTIAVTVAAIFWFLDSQ